MAPPTSGSGGTSGLPHDLSTWTRAARRAGIDKLQLSQINRGGPFSGSKISPDAYLQLRAVWLPPRDPLHAAGALYEAGFVGSPDLTTGAVGRSRDSSHLMAFLDQLADSDPSTPPVQSGPSEDLFAIEEKLGIFIPCLSLWRQLKPQAKRTQRTNRHGGRVATPTNAARRNAYLPTQTPPPSLDFSMTHPLDTGPAESSLEMGRDELQHLMSSMSFDTPSKAAPPAPSKLPDSRVTNTVFVPPPVEKDDVDVDLPSPAAATGPATRSKRQVASVSASDMQQADAKPTKDTGVTKLSRGRTAYEVQTSNFFVTFFHTLFAYHLSLFWSQFIQVVAEERQYSFGPSLFLSSPDGAFYSRAASPPMPFLHFELKPYRRDQNEAKICREETAEIVAILSEELQRGHGILPPEDDEQHRLMLSFDKDEFHITVVSFTGRYLRYISNPASIGCPRGKDLRADDMISFQRFGPFPLHDTDSLVAFTRIMTEVAAHKIQEEAAGAAMMQALS